MRLVSQRNVVVERSTYILRINNSFVSQTFTFIFLPADLCFEIAELRASVENLRATSEQTSQQLENLSRSVSSSIVTQERDKSSQLKDNIRQVSQNVTVSTEASRKERAPHSSHKPGSVGYGHDAHVETSTARLSMERGADENRMLDVDGRNRVDEEDEFMAIAPAEVDNSWVSGQFGMGKAEVKQDEEYGMGKEEGHTTIQQKDLRKSVNGLSNEAKVVAGQADNRWIASNNEKENEDLYEGGVGEEEEVVEGQGLSETSRLLAQKLFQRDLMHEAQQWAVNDNGSKDGTSMKNRPLSMPQMDTPLSDTDY